MRSLPRTASVSSSVERSAVTLKWTTRRANKACRMSVAPSRSSGICLSTNIFYRCPWDFREEKRAAGGKLTYLRKKIEQQKKVRNHPRHSNKRRINIQPIDEAGTRARRLDKLSRSRECLERSSKSPTHVSSIIIIPSRLHEQEPLRPTLSTGCEDKWDVL